MPIKLLFICTHNRCRSILAEAVTNNLANGEIIAASAGSSPQGEVHPLSIQFLQERGINTEGLRSQSWDEFEELAPHAIVTMCDTAAAETCPLWFDPSIQVHWGLKDPSKNVSDEAATRIAFDKTINIIEQRVHKLLESDLAALDGPKLRQRLTEIATQIN